MNKLVMLLIPALCARALYADFIEIDDREAWFDAVPGGVTTIGFSDFPEFTFITDQYEDLGVLFLDGDDQTGFGPTTYPQDGWGLDGQASIHLQFTQPMLWIAADFPGGLVIELFDDGDLIYTSSQLAYGGIGNFGGILSSMPFDAAILTDGLGGQVFLDDLHFGPPVPAPATVVLLGAVLLVGRSRRRSF